MEGPCIACGRTTELSVSGTAAVEGGPARPYRVATCERCFPRLDGRDEPPRAANMDRLVAEIARQVVILH